MGSHRGDGAKQSARHVWLELFGEELSNCEGTDDDDR